MASLCAPSERFSCFACCPPIRPGHYDHLDHEAILRRELRENRLDYLSRGPRFRPIVGFSCWALGFLDKKGRRVGCLLHPSRNEGEDLRFLVDYGDKCEREICIAAKFFDQLTIEHQDFWISIVEGFDSFRFSSPKANPLFHVLLWGREILEKLHRQAIQENWTGRDLLLRYSLIRDPAWNPLAHRFLLRLALESDAPKGHTWQAAELLFMRLRERVHNHPAARNPSLENEPTVFTHLLPFQREFLDFLRLDLGWKKASHTAVRQLEIAVREEAGLLFRT